MTKQDAVGKIEFPPDTPLELVHDSLDNARAKLEPASGALRVLWEGSTAFLVPAVKKE